MTCALTNADQVKCWGLGFGPVNDAPASQLLKIVPTPTTVAGFESAVGVSVGWKHACAPIAGGARCWGSNLHGELGSGDDGAPQRASDVVDLADSVGLAAGGHHTYALLQDRGVVCWGRFRSGFE